MAVLAGCCCSTYFNPRPPRGGRLCRTPVLVHPAVISIHALREEGDLPFEFQVVNAGKISIHALREEGDERRAPH